VDQYALASNDLWKQDIGIADAVGTTPRLPTVTVAAASTAIADRLSLFMTSIQFSAALRAVPGHQR
jgi:hypothetical protein